MVCSHGSESQRPHLDRVSERSPCTMSFVDVQICRLKTRLAGQTLLTCHGLITIERMDASGRKRELIKQKPPLLPAHCGTTLT